MTRPFMARTWILLRVCEEIPAEASELVTLWVMARSLPPRAVTPAWLELVASFRSVGRPPGVAGLLAPKGLLFGADGVLLAVPRVGDEDVLSVEVPVSVALAVLVRSGSAGLLSVLARDGSEVAGVSRVAAVLWSELCGLALLGADCKSDGLELSEPEAPLEV